MEIGLLTLPLAAALQLLAAIWALRLIPLTGGAKTWLAFTAAFMLMAVRRIIGLLEQFDVIHGGAVFNNLDDIIALTISILMMLGVYLVRGIFEERQQARQKLQQQLDELLRFQKLTVGRELRMKELMEENATLRQPLPHPSKAKSSARCERHDAEHPTTAKELEDNRNALLFMLEDLEAGRNKIALAHQEWMAALDVVNDPIFLHDKQFRILRCNKAYQQCAGIPLHEIIGQPYYEVFPKNHEPLSSCLRALEKAAVEEEEEEEEEEEVLVDDANYRSRSFSIHDEQGAYLYSVHTLEDITERKQMEKNLLRSETKFRTVYDSSSDAIMLLDEQGFFDCNESTLQVFGCPTRDDFINKHPSQLSPPTQPGGEDSMSLANERIATAFKNGSNRFEWIHCRLDGSEFPAEVQLTAMELGGKQVLQATVRDISQRKKEETELHELLKAANQSRQAMLSMLEDQRRADEAVHRLNEELENKVAARTAALEQTKIKAEQANRAKSDFLATMSHEIRTPMNGVIGMIDVLQQSSLNAQQLEITHIIHDSAFALLTVINDILDFSRIEAGKIEIDRLPMSIVEVVEGVGETLDTLAMNKGVELTLFTDPAIPAEVIGDPGRLRQILLNLTNNAIKFSSEQDHPCKASLRAMLVESGSDESHSEQVTLEFRVTDNGIGMDEATQARLFTAFTQADSSITRHYGGSGLGLAISAHLTSLMGGAITVQSELGKGSLFSVFLSFALPPAQPAADAAPSPVAESLVAELPCLLMDGPDGMADDLAVYLVHAGARVERATGLAAARQWISDHSPGLCIVVIDSADNNPPLDELRAAARARSGQDVRFVVIGRGRRRLCCRSDMADMVALDANVLHRHAFLEVVAVAAGRAKAPERESLPGTAKTPAPLSREEARQQGSLILVAEDNEINQKVILQQLALLGRTADIAGNGREALEMWQKGDYAMLFADLHMPEMNGYELTATIRAAETGASETNKPRAPIIAFTANALKGEAEHCLAIGMDDYLSKPVQLVNLKAMLEKWLPVAENRGLEAAPTGTRPVDVNVLKALVGDDAAMIRELLQDFRISADKLASELRTACTVGQAMAAGAAAHELKSTSRAVGALALGDLCAEMEQAGKAGDMKVLTALLPRFEAELSSVEGCLQGY